MWGSDGSLEWKERGAQHSVAAGKGNMNSIFVHAPCQHLYFFMLHLFHIQFFPCSFLSHILKEVFCGLSVATITVQSDADPAQGRLRLLSSLTAFSGYERDHQWHQRDWSRLMKTPDASSHHNHLVPSQVWFDSINMQWHFLYLWDCHCHASIWGYVKAHFYDNEMIILRLVSGESYFALVYVVVIALLLWTKSTILSVLVVGKTERLKLHRSHGGLFWAPKESGRRQAAGSGDSFVLSAGEPLSPQHVCSLQLFTAQALCDLNEERSGRMLCATSPGECVGTPRL